MFCTLRRRDGCAPLLRQWSITPVHSNFNTYFQQNRHKVRHNKQRNTECFVFRNRAFVFYYYAKHRRNLLRQSHKLVTLSESKWTKLLFKKNHEFFSVLDLRSKTFSKKSLLLRNQHSPQGEITHYMKQISFDYSANVLCFRYLDCLHSKSVFHMFSLVCGLGMKKILIMCFTFCLHM